MKRFIGLMILISMCSALFFPLEIFASNSYSISDVSVSVLDSEMNEITGKIPPEEDFYVKAAVSGSENALSFSVYCAVFNKDGMVLAFKGDNADGESEATVRCRIPESTGNDYFIKIFVWGNTDLTPLNDMIVFNASSPYETEYVASKDMYTGKELFKDASFENDNMITDGWDSRNHSTISRKNDYILDGSYSCKVENRGSCYDSIRQNITYALSSSGNGDYQLEYNVLPVVSNSEEPNDNTADTLKIFSASLVMYDNSGNMTTVIRDKWDDLRIYDSAYGNWNQCKKTIGIELPEALYNAEFYVETASATDAKTGVDFYIDKCSLKKLITHQQYLLDNTPADYSDADMNDYLEIIKSCTSANSVSVYPKSSNELIANPYKGLVYYTTNADLSKLDLTKDGAKNAKVVYHRFSWKALEPEEGKYNFDIIEKNIEILKQHNMMLGIGIGSCLTYNSYNNTTNAQGVPDWLFDTYNIPYTLQEVGDGSKANSNVYNDPKTKKQYIKVPVYSNSVFKEKMKNFMDAFAEKFNGNPNIAYVDMRTYGNWGEWHFSSFNDTIRKHSYYDENNILQTYAEDDFNALVDMFENFKLPLAMFTSRTGQLTYAVEKYNAGIRVDGTMNPYLCGEHRKMTYADGKSFSVAEWYDQPEQYNAGGKYADFKEYMPVYMEKVIKEGKASYMAMGYWNPESFYSEYSDLVKRTANKVGYWYKVSKIVYPKNLTGGLFSMTVKNDGSAQLYPGYKGNACVKLALADENGNIIDTTVLKGINPVDWKAGKYSYVTAQYSFTNTANSQKLYFGIFSDEENQNPDIRLGIDATDVNGWYDVASIAYAEHKSDNKLYTASYPYADYGYGYREPLYAFDNDYDTYWASEIRKDEFLEINFGEYVCLSEMMINAADAAAVNYSLMGYDGNSWITLCSGDGFAQGENNVSFSEKKVSKVRLVFNESAEKIFKVKEMYID